MRNLEGIKIIETKEKDIEAKSTNASEAPATFYDEENYDACMKTPEDRKKELQDLKEELLYYETCRKIDEETHEIDENYDDCRKK